jgi:hypothetical protein
VIFKLSLMTALIVAASSVGALSTNDAAAQERNCSPSYPGVGPDYTVACQEGGEGRGLVLRPLRHPGGWKAARA